MKLREDQVAAVSAAAAERFARRAAEHVRSAFPREAAALGGSGVDSLVAYAVRRAGDYGITSEVDVVKFLNLVVVFGRGFAQAPPTWARRILEADESASRRVRQLCRAAEQRA